MLSKNLNLFFAGIIILFAACQSGQDSKTTNSDQSDFHKITVQEALQTSEYTYLHAKENGSELWLAVPSMQAKAGDTYYYQGGFSTTNLESKELHRIFESIILLDKIYSEPKTSAVVATNSPAANPVSENPASPGQEGAQPTAENYTRKATPPEKKDIKVDVPNGGISIATLFAKKESYSGKTVKIKGQVTKYTPAVMNKNWIHIQDGTDHQGKFDLTVTSEAEVKVGDLVTFEGKVSLNKDLGYGYFFDVIMEDAKIK